jgi:hypothetical protein
MVSSTMDILDSLMGMERSRGGEGESEGGGLDGVLMYEPRGFDERTGSRSLGEMGFLFELL